MASRHSASVADYLRALPPEQRAVVAGVRKVLRANLPRGFKEGIRYGMVAYYVPLSRYPNTYNGQPLSVACLGAQKHYVSLYLMAVYGHRDTERWLREEFRKAGKKLDMGKSCVRFKTLDDLPLDVIAKAIARVNIDDFIAIYERARGATGTRRSRSRTDPAARGRR